MKLFILCGEPSGDRLAADLVQRLRARTNVDLVGVGGPELIGQGLRSLFPMHELSVMGGDILPRLPWLLFRAWQTARAVARSRADLAIFVDAQIFSAVVARQARRRNVRCPILLYVAPSVWAWAPERAARLVPLFDEVLSVLPFEPEVMHRLNGPPTTFVGHPAAGRLAQRPAIPARGPLLLLPGSRQSELRRHLPLMREVVAQLATHPRVAGFVLPTLAALRVRIAAEVANWPAKVEVVSGPDERSRAYEAAVAACAVMGTATLELALAGVPTVGVYAADRDQERRWFKYNVRYASLPNNILQEPLIPEVLFVEPDAVQLVTALRDVLEGEAAQRQLEGFARIRLLMEQGAPDAPAVDAVERVLAHAAQPRPSTGT